MPIRQMLTFVGPKNRPSAVVSPVRAAVAAASAAHARLSSGRLRPRLAYAQINCNDPIISGPPGRPLNGPRASTACAARAYARSYEPQALAALARAYAAYPRRIGSSAASAASRQRSAPSQDSAG